MAKSVPVKVALEVTGVSKKGDQVILSFATGAIEVQRSSHADLTKVQAGTKVEFEVTPANKKKLDSGNAVPASFTGICVEQPQAAPRVSDSRGS